MACTSLYEFRRMRTILLSLSILLSSFPSSHAGKHLVTLKQGRQLLVETSGTVEEKSTSGKERATNVTSKDRRHVEKSGSAEEKSRAERERIVNRPGTWKYEGNSPKIFRAESPDFLASPDAQEVM